jgi:stage II sporulation protein D
MVPQRVKVAITHGIQRVAMRSTFPIRIISKDGAESEFYGKMEILLQETEPAETIKWFWCGIDPTPDKINTLKQKGLEVLLLPIGLTPAGDHWQPRHVRLLVRGGHHLTGPQVVIEDLKSIFPLIDPVEVTLPDKSGAGVFLIRDSDGHNEIFRDPITLQSDGPIEILNAPVGKGFHWEHEEILVLNPPLWVAIGSDGRLCAGVDTEIEDYLISVNSSEMPADSPIEFLKAQVIAARSWLLANWGSHHPGEPFTVCAGDHCQCYYGISRLKPASKQATQSTSGEVLLYDGKVCDARYAKACGGVTEPSKNVWAFVDEPYLTSIRDLPGAEIMDLSDEKAFKNFQIRSIPRDACCSPGYEPLRGRLAELTGLYRWKKVYAQSEIGKIIRQKIGEVMGEIREIIPNRRGPSGRLMEVTVVGENRSITLSPELRIRYILSESHLPSSAFWIETVSGGMFIFRGLGWGHGVGLCQIGAAALAVRGWDYPSILEHYFPGTSLQKIY